MTRDELYNEIAKHTEDQYKSDMIMTAVDAYSSALLQQCNVSGSLPPYSELLDFCRSAAYAGEKWDLNSPFAATIKAREILEKYEDSGGNDR